MEIEVKFAIPNRQVYRELGRQRSVAGYALAPKRTVNVTDHYLDTADSRLLAAGYTCRLRTRGDAVIATLKSLGSAQGPVHRRDEQEVLLSAWTSNVPDWPESPARTLAEKLVAGAELNHLFDLTQRRAELALLDGQRLVAEMSLDAVRVAVGKRPALYYELEVELRETGTEADLAAVATALASDWGLIPESRSKFERALETLRTRGNALEDRLAPEERALLAGYAAGADADVARRASVVLGWADGLPTREIAQRSGLSSGRVRYWLRAFRSDRMAIFLEPDRAAAPALLLKTVAPEMQAEKGANQSAQDAAPAPPEEPVGLSGPRHTEQTTATDGPLAIGAFCRQNGVDIAHARRVANHALRLFDLLDPVHKLARKRRRLLKMAAFLNTVGVSADPDRPHHAGRDLILAQPLRNVSETERLALACIVAFNRRKVRPESERAMKAVESGLRADVVPMTALLRMAEGLEASGSLGTDILGFTGECATQCELMVSGPAAQQDAERATQCADLWQSLHQQQLIFTPQPGGVFPAAGPTDAQVVELAVGEPARPRVEPGSLALLPDDSMSEAGRKVLYRHFSKMLANEEGTRLGEDIEALHDMRVATRRMRAAFEVFAPYYDEQAIKPFRKGLRRTGRVLGAVRDLDVLLDKAMAYQAGLAPEQADSVEPLLATWQNQRAAARTQMFEHLDSRDYRRFVARFEIFLTTPGGGAAGVPSGEPTPHEIRHVVPSLILARYEAVRAYEPVLPQAPITMLHRLRIDCKRLRYALEYFRDVLGQETPELIGQVVGMQDLLGDLQDAYVAEGLLIEFLVSLRKKNTGAALPGVGAYLAMQQATQQNLILAFPTLWKEIVSYDFRRMLGLCLAAL